MKMEKKYNVTINTVDGKTEVCLLMSERNEDEILERFIDVVSDETFLTSGKKIIATKQIVSIKVEEYEDKKHF